MEDDCAFLLNLLFLECNASINKETINNSWLMVFYINLSFFKIKFPKIDLFSPKSDLFALICILKIFNWILSKHLTFHTYIQESFVDTILTSNSIFRLVWRELCLPSLPSRPTERRQYYSAKTLWYQCVMGLSICFAELETSGMHVKLLKL